MKLSIENPGEAGFAGYVTVEIVDDADDVLLEAHVAPDFLDEIADGMTDPGLLRLLAELKERDVL